MKILVRLLLSACCGLMIAPVWSLDPPASEPARPAPPPAATAPSSSEPAAPTNESADAPKAVSATTASATAAKPAPTVLEDKTLTQDEVKQILAQGYRPMNRDGQLYYCRRESELGSRFESLRCRTAEQAKDLTRNGRDMLDKLQRPSGCRANGAAC
jgi:hypothetical protein